MQSSNAFHTTVVSQRVEADCWELVCRPAHSSTMNAFLLIIDAALYCWRLLRILYRSVLSKPDITLQRQSNTFINIDYYYAKISWALKSTHQNT